MLWAYEGSLYISMDHRLEFPNRDIFKVSKEAKIRNLYNQVPHPMKIKSMKIGLKLADKKTPGEMPHSVEFHLVSPLDKNA